MALGIVSDSEFDAEVNKCEHVEMKRGRGNTKEVPEVIREVIAEEVLTTNKTQKDIANERGVSASSVSAYTHDATSTASYNEPDKRLRKHNDVIRDGIITNAKQKLLDALGEITSDKMRDAKLRDVASVAKDMSAVIRNIEPVNNPTIGNAQFIFHVPKQREEKEFEIIDVTQ